MYCLFDSSVIAAYYCPSTTRSKKLVKRARNLIESVRSGESKHFFYIPNFCIAETFSVFMKYAYSNWNRSRNSGSLHGKTHNMIRAQFQNDIHNAHLFYHYELNRYHILAINLVAPIDHHYKLYRKKKKRGQNPAGTFDQLIIAMGLHLVKIHGRNNVVIITADDRLARIVDKCRLPIPISARNRLKLKDAAILTGIPFKPESFPLVMNMAKITKTKLKETFGAWPLPLKKRYKKPYLAKEI